MRDSGSIKLHQVLEKDKVPSIIEICPDAFSEQLQIEACYHKQMVKYVGIDNEQGNVNDTHK